MCEIKVNVKKNEEKSEKPVSAIKLEIVEHTEGNYEVTRALKGKASDLVQALFAFLQKDLVFAHALISAVQIDALCAEHDVKHMGELPPEVFAEFLPKLKKHLQQLEVMMKLDDIKDMIDKGTKAE